LHLNAKELHLDIKKWHRWTVFPILLMNCNYITQ
jgi:hypothetical protein